MPIELHDCAPLRARLTARACGINRRLWQKTPERFEKLAGCEGCPGVPGAEMEGGGKEIKPANPFNPDDRRITLRKEAVGREQKAVKAKTKTRFPDRPRQADKCELCGAQPLPYLRRCRKHLLR